MKILNRVAVCASFAGLIAFSAGASAADGYPNRPVRLITPAQPGGSTDILARMVGVRLTDVFKQQIVVDNRASASGVIAADITAHSPPDGYTLFLAYHQHTVNAALNDKLPYHAVNDFTPITQLTSAGLILVVNPSSPVKNFKEFMEWTRNFKGPLNFGSAGNGSGGHLAGELYKLMTGVKAQHIPYKGAGPSLIDLVAGQYQYNFVGMLAAGPFLRSGKLRPVAVTAARRVTSMPDLPTVAESGLPGFEVVGWYGVVGPAKMQKPVVGRLHDEIVKVLKIPDVRERIIADGAEPIGNTPEEFRLYMLADLAKWAKLVKETGAKLD
jgi:tripartite-type tricarboxylate transporter receptor subunit TctC